MQFTLHIPTKLGRYTNDELFELCLANPDLRIERNSQHELIFMSPTGFLSSSYNSKLNFALELWNSKKNLGIVTDSNGGYLLPNGAMRVPDVAWISHDRLNKTTAAEQKKFLSSCPEFVIELKSNSDRKVELEGKMNEWIENGAKLAWLIDPESKITSVFGFETSQFDVKFSENLTGLAILPDFKVCLEDLFSLK